ncbi:hypothetical protein [Azospirillum palustre]
MHIKAAGERKPLTIAQVKHGDIIVKGVMESKSSDDWVRYINKGAMAYEPARFDASWEDDKELRKVIEEHANLADKLILPILFAMSSFGSDCQPIDNITQDVFSWLAWRMAEYGWDEDGINRLVHHTMKAYEEAVAAKSASEVE